MSYYLTVIRPIAAERGPVLVAHVLRLDIGNADGSWLRQHADEIAERHRSAHEAPHCALWVSDSDPMATLQ